MEQRLKLLTDDRSYNYTHKKTSVVIVTLVKKGMYTPESEPLNEVTLQYLVNF